MSEPAKEDVFSEMEKICRSVEGLIEESAVALRGRDDRLSLEEARLFATSGIYGFLRERYPHLKKLSDISAKRPKRDSARVSESLSVVIGSAPGKRLAIKHDGTMHGAVRDGSTINAWINGWTWAAVIASHGDKARFWFIKPGSAYNEFGLEPFGVRGHFSVEVQTNNARQAREAFRQICQLDLAPKSA